MRGGILVIPHLAALHRMGVGTVMGLDRHHIAHLSALQIVKKFVLLWPAIKMVLLSPGMPAPLLNHISTNPDSGMLLKVTVITGVTTVVPRAIVMRP